MSDETALIQVHSRVDVAQAQPQQDVAKSLPALRAGFTKVILADYPSTGSTWLKKLLGAVSQGKVNGNPACAMYAESQCMLNGTKNIWCDCDGFDPNQDAALVKTHFPSQNMFLQQDIHDWQYDESTNYDKLIHLVRHPTPTVMSSVHRWGAPHLMLWNSADRQAVPIQADGKTYVAANVLEWGSWWENVKAEKGKPSMLLRYEDLCLNTAAKVYDVLQFIGGRFASIPLNHIEEVLLTQPELQSIRDVHDLHNETQRTPETEFIFKMMEGTDLMSKWGYQLGADEWSDTAKPSLVGISASTQPKGKRWLSRWLSEQNPWKVKP